VTLEQTRPARRTVSLLDDLATDLAPYLANSSEEMRRRLAPVLDQRAALGRTELQAESLREQLSDVTDRNAELRETLRTLGAATDAARAALRAQLTRQLAESMARHAALSRDLAAKGGEAAALRTQLVDALRGLRYDEDAAGATPGRASTS
jgi:chromosome segregation ATPase